MRLLILGGTRFVGRHLTEAALAAGHQVTLFNRGRTNPDLFPQAEHLRGDRARDLSALQGRRWDAAIDVNGYLPRQVRASAELLAGAVERYVFISTISVYADWKKPGTPAEIEALGDRAAVVRQIVAVRLLRIPRSRRDRTGRPCLGRRGPCAARHLRFSFPARSRAAGGMARRLNSPW